MKRSDLTIVGIVFSGVLLLTLASCGGDSDASSPDTPSSNWSYTNLCADSLISAFEEIVKTDADFQTRVKTPPPDWYEELSRREAAEALAGKIQALRSHDYIYCAMKTDEPAQYLYQHTATIELRLTKWRDLHK